MIRILLWPRLTKLVWLIWLRDMKVFGKNWRSNIMFNFIEPFFYLLAMGFGLGVYVDNINGLPYLQFIAPGLAASSAMWATASECTYDSFVRLQFQKVYHAIITTPASVEEVVAGEMLFGVFKSVLYGSVIIIVLLVLGLVRSTWVVLVPPVLALSGLVLAELSMIWTSLSPRIETFNYFFTLVITPMYLFGGVFFPVEGMPVAVQYLSWFTPLYHTTCLTRALTLGQVNSNLWIHAVWLAAAGGILFNLPVHFMRRRLID